MKTKETVLKKKQNGITRAFLQAIAYRTPLPVTKVIVYFDDTAYPLCPRCASALEREYVFFCDQCGQKLEWKFYPHAKVVRPGCKGKMFRKMSLFRFWKHIRLKGIGGFDFGKSGIGQADSGIPD